MPILIGGISGELQYLEGLTSVHNLVVRKGDDVLIQHNTQGQLARGEVLETFFNNKKYSHLLMLDMDMKHNPNTLERFREYDLDMVTAHYFRRQTDPMYSVCSVLTPDDRWPYPPLLDVPEKGRYEIMISGFGCVLFSRKVLEAVQATLQPGDNAFYSGLMPQEGSYGLWGADYRFFTIARKLGFKLWLDAEMESEHGCVVWLNRDLYKKLGGQGPNSRIATEHWKKGLHMYGATAQSIEERIKQLKEQKEKQLKAFEEGKKRLAQVKSGLTQLRDTLLSIDARLAEMDAWKKELEKGDTPKE